MGLAIIDHLQTMLDDPQPVIGPAQQRRIIASDESARRQCIQAGAGPAQPQRRMPAAVNQLMRLGKEFDLANAAASALEVEAGAGTADLAMRCADAAGEPADFGNRTEIEALAPHEGADRGKKRLARRDVASSGAGADEGGAFPRQRRGFIMAKRRLHRDRQRADFGSRTQPQVDAKHIALGIDMRECLDDLLRQPLCRFARIVARTTRQAQRIVQQDGIDVRAVVQFLRAMLAQRQGDEAAAAHVRDGVRRAALDGLGNGRIERAIGQRGKLAHHPRQRKHPGQIADAQRQRIGQPLAAQAKANSAGVTIAGRSLVPRPVERRLAFTRRQQVDQFRQPRHGPRQKGRVRLGPAQRVAPCGRAGQACQLI